jgi:hypothetical protein
MESSAYLQVVDEAIDDTVHRHPEYFDLNDIQGAGGYRVLSLGGLTVGVIESLDRMGYCGGQYGEELAVKQNNNYSENFALTSSKGYVRRGSSTYRSTCTPASFTNTDPPVGNNPGCTLNYSHALACSRELQRIVFLDQVMAAIDKVGKEHPEIFDFTSHAPGTNGVKVLHPDAYTKAVVANLLAAGLCARWDGEEINVKNTDDWSENYDILTADSFERVGEGAYRVTCYPAYF